MEQTAVLLDPDFASTLGQQVYGFTAGQAGVGLLGIASFLMFLFLLADGGAAIIRILYAIGLSSVSLEPSSATISTSKKIIRTTLLSLLGSFSLVLIMLAVNPDVVTGDVDLTGITSANSQRIGLNAGTLSSPACADEAKLKMSLSSGGGVCGQIQCTALIGCDMTYKPDIIKEANRQGVDPALALAIMCQESKGKKSPKPNINTSSGTVDCGLMQINKPGSTCSPEDEDVPTNISKGIAQIRQKFSQITQTYPTISREMLVLASYNCCGTEGSPNQASKDCTPASGFPFTLPRWACPINPGPSQTNMCFVRNYVCNISNCLGNP